VAQATKLLDMNIDDPAWRERQFERSLVELADVT